MKPGFKGLLRSLLRAHCIHVSAVCDVSFMIHEGQMVGGVCPTRREIQTGETTANEQGELLFDDEHSFALLGRFARTLGRTIIVARNHLADIAELPEALGCQLMTALLRLTRALTEATGCDKVYQVIMCSGALLHPHFQLLPRLPGRESAAACPRHREWRWPTRGRWRPPSSKQSKDSPRPRVPVPWPARSFV